MGCSNNKSSAALTYRNALRYAADTVPNATSIAIDGAANAPTSGGDFVASLYAIVSTKLQPRMLVNDP